MNTTDFVLIATLGCLIFVLGVLAVALLLRGANTVTIYMGDCAFGEPPDDDSPDEDEDPPTPAEDLHPELDVDWWKNQ